MANLSLENQEGLFDYFRVYLPAAPSHQLAKLIVHWTRNKGCEWTVDRLKTIKVQLLNFYGGHPINLVKSRDGIAVGPFAYLFKVGLEKAMKTVHVYTSYISPCMTKKQKLKFVSAVESEFNHSIHPIKHIGNFDQVLVNHLKRTKQSSVYTFFDGKQRAPHLVDGKLKTVFESTLTPTHLIGDMVDVSEANRSLLSRYTDLLVYSTGFTKLEITKEIWSRRKPLAFDGPSLVQSLREKPLVGTIGFIQEKGAKLRSVANPFRVLQCALGPFGDYLYSLLKELPWDCTHSQEDGAIFAQSALARGETVYAYDLSNATDKLPLDIQTSLMLDLIQKPKVANFSETGEENTLTEKLDLMIDSINLLREVSRAEWSSPALTGYTKKRDTISWLTGQPQGLYPSFAMFAITHGFILREIEIGLNLSDSFRIVGDDVVITNKLVANSYKARMQGLGVEISAPKTIVSDLLTEFVGFTITKDTIYRSFKWQPYKHSNPFGPLRSLGYKGMKFIPPKARRFVKTVVSQPEPIGLGLNPEGLTLESRLAPTWRLFEDKAYSRSTENSYSYNDVHTSMQEFWDNVVIPEELKHYVLRKQEISSRPVLGDSLRQNHDISIEHFNSVTKDVTVHDQCDYNHLKVDSPSHLRPHRGTFKKDGFVMSNVRKAFKAIRDYVG